MTINNLNDNVTLLNIVNKANEISQTLNTSTQSNMWVPSLHNLCEQQTYNAGSTHTFDLSEYIPNDGNDYELIMLMTCNSGNVVLSSGNYSFVGGNYADSTDRAQLVVPLEKTNRTLSIYVYSKAVKYWLQLVAYRKIPSNIIVQNTVDPNFIPKDTVLTVELDGSGDFDNINSALNYLNGKYSNGQVIIALGEGTFNINTNTRIEGRNFNIPVLEIRGKSKNTTTISCSATNAFEYIILVYNQKVYFKEISFIQTNGTKNTQLRGIISATNADVNFYQSNKFIGCYESICVFNGGRSLIEGNIEVINAGRGISSLCASIHVAYGTNFTFNNVTTAFNVSVGGNLLIDNNSTCNTTNVTNVFSQSKGTLTNQGYISAPF